MVLHVKDKKKLTLLIVTLMALSVTSLIWFHSSKVTFQEPNNYSEAIEYLTEISLDDVNTKMKKDDSFILYIGRESCPYCRKFAPKLARAAFQSKKTVYYLNSESKDKKQITEFARQHGIQTVPNLGYYKATKLVTFLEKGSKSSVTEIEEFLNNQ